MNKPANHFFNKEMAQRYDERNSKLAPISSCLHFLTELVLKEAPPKARVLCVGVGTGVEILYLAKRFPNWTFIALDPSFEMLEVCRERVQTEGFIDRCEFIHGYVYDLPDQTEYEIAISLLVAHFIKRDERTKFFQRITQGLTKGGYLVNAEISFDLNSKEFPSMLKNWEAVQSLMGGTSESLAKLPQQLKEVLTVLSPSETEAILQQSRIETPVRFFQSFMISAWYGKRY